MSETPEPPAGTTGPPVESARAKRRRIQQERQEALDAALARGLSEEDAAREADAIMRERAKQEAIAAAAAKRAAAEAAAASAMPEAAPTAGAAQGDTGAPSRGSTGVDGPAAGSAPSTNAAAAPPSTPKRAHLEHLGEPHPQPEPQGKPSPEGPSRALLGRFVNPSKAPRWLGNLTYLIGLLNVLIGVWRPGRQRLHRVTDILPGALNDAATALTIVAGILLMLLGHSLKRRKQRAWVAVLVLLGVSVVLHVLHDVRTAPVAFSLSLIALVLFLVQRRQFYARSDRGTRWRALWAFLLLLLISVVVGMLLVAANSRAFLTGWPGFGDALNYVLQGLVGLEAPLMIDPARERTGDLMGAVLLGLGIMTVLITAYLFLRSPKQPATLSDEDDARVRALLDRHPDSLGYFTTRRDKQVVWSETGKSCIGYRVVTGVMLAGGDPVGDPEAWPGAIKAFLTEADRHAWTPAVLGCSELAGNTWVRETGFVAFEIGDEAIVETTGFTLEGRLMRNVRQMVNRIRRLGYSTEMMRVRDTDEEMRRAAMHDASAWRVGGTERGFSMATSRVMDAELDPDDVVIIARREGVVEGMLQFVPWGRDGMSLDLMRRNPEADPGINELLIADALTGAEGMGIRRVSLNFAMFRSTFERGERLGAGPVVRLTRRVLIVGNRWFQLESLYKFNQKFQPLWYPRYIIFPRVSDLARVGIAMGEAEAFISKPRLAWPRRRHEESVE